MDLLNDKVFETDNSRRLLKLFSEFLIGSGKNSLPFEFYIQYDEFKDIIYNFIKEIMEIFLTENKCSNDGYKIIIKELPKSNRGFFIKYNNTLVINEDVIRCFYYSKDGDMNQFIVIFHELNHFKYKYDILNGTINQDICRIMKERLLREENTDDSFKSFKGKNSYIKDYYYCDNYENFSEEVIATINAKRDVTLLMQFLLIFNKISDDNSIKLVDKMFDDSLYDDFVRYNNHIRDFSSSFYFNDIYLDFNIAFDVSVRFHPEWLKYPQISIEYYIDENDEVKKRNVEQLQKLFNEFDNSETREYIQLLIDNIERNSNKNRS